MKHVIAWRSQGRSLLAGSGRKTRKASGGLGVKDIPASESSICNGEETDRVWRITSGFILRKR